MKDPDGVFLYIGTYPDELSARADYDLVKDLHAAGAVGTMTLRSSPRTRTARSM